MTQKNNNDEFISGPSGEGYHYPGIYGSDGAYSIYSKRMEKFLNRFGMSIINILDAEDSKPKKLAEALDALSKFTDGIFYYPYGNYAGWKGKIEWVNNCPIIGGRHRLWSGFENPSSLAAKLNSYSNDFTTSDGYSLIPVHVWSMDYSKVLETFDLLDKNKVEVVTPTEFVKRIRQNIKNE